MEREEIDDLEESGRQMPSAGMMLGVGMAIVGLGVLGWMIYRRRQQSRTLVQQLTQRLPKRLPTALDDMRDELLTQIQRVRSR